VFTAQRPDQLWVVDFERHETFANPGGGGRPPLDACRSGRVEAGGRSIASAWGWLVEQSSTTTGPPSTARWGGLGYRDGQAYVRNQWPNAPQDTTTDPKPGGHGSEAHPTPP
jgi:hypothetical protein